MLNPRHYSVCCTDESLNSVGSTYVLQYEDVADLVFCLFSFFAYDQRPRLRRPFCEAFVPSCVPRS